MLRSQDKTTLVAVETTGTASLQKSVAANELITLASIDSIAKSLGANRVSATAFALRESHKLQCKLVSDADALRACIRYRTATGTLVEPACGAALAMVASATLLDDICPRGATVVLIVCGGSVINDEWLAKYVKEFLE